MTAFPWLTTVILYPVLAALAIPLIPDPEGKGRPIRWYALFIGITDFVILLAGYYVAYDPGVAGLQLQERYAWVPQVGLSWSVGADGLSMPLILLTAFITTLAILAAWPVTLKPRLFYFLMLNMYGAQIGVFAVQDMLLFFLMWEL
ncbi:MAG: NAD(P)H-quinone oxidoreductase subunit 4, partial [Thermostichales cyanobacterium GMQP_bins_62]